MAVEWDLNLTTPGIKTSDEASYLDVTSCRELLNTTTDVPPSEFRIQIIAAAPGSGSDWSLITISLLTGFGLSIIL